MQDDTATAEKAAVSELSSAILKALDRKGALDKLKAQLRGEVFHCIEGSLDDFHTERRQHQQESSAPEELAPSPPQLPEGNILINELFMEYLTFNGYYNTASVLQSEIGWGGRGEDERNVRFDVDRAFIAQELGMEIDTELLQEENDGVRNNHGNGNDVDLPSVQMLDKIPILYSVIASLKRIRTG